MDYKIIEAAQKFVDKPGTNFLFFSKLAQILNGDNCQELDAIEFPSLSLARNKKLTFFGKIYYSPPHLKELQDYLKIYYQARCLIGSMNKLALIKPEFDKKFFSIYHLWDTKCSWQQRRLLMLLANDECRDYFIKNSDSKPSHIYNFLVNDDPEKSIMRIFSQGMSIEKNKIEQEVLNSYVKPCKANENSLVICKI